MWHPSPMNVDFCVAALEEALKQPGRLEIFNTDRRSQFASDDFTNALKDAGMARMERPRSRPHTPSLRFRPAPHFCEPGGVCRWWKRCRPETLMAPCVSTLLHPRKSQYMRPFAGGSWQLIRFTSTEMHTPWGSPRVKDLAIPTSILW